MEGATVSPLPNTASWPFGPIVPHYHGGDDCAMGTKAGTAEYFQRMLDVIAKFRNNSTQFCTDDDCNGKFEKKIAHNIFIQTIPPDIAQGVEIT